MESKSCFLGFKALNGFLSIFSVISSISFINQLLFSLRVPATLALSKSFLPSHGLWTSCSPYLKCSSLYVWYSFCLECPSHWSFHVCHFLTIQVLTQMSTLQKSISGTHSKGNTQLWPVKSLPSFHCIVLIIKIFLRYFSGHFYVSFLSDSTSMKLQETKRPSLLVHYFIPAHGSVCGT